MIVFRVNPRSDRSYDLKNEAASSLGAQHLGDSATAGISEPIYHGSVKQNKITQLWKHVLQQGGALHTF